LGSPAKGEIAPGEVQIWKFTATPNEPLIVHWNSSSWDYQIETYNDKGEGDAFQSDNMDDNNRYGFLRVREPHTYVIVLTGGKSRASYTIDLSKVAVVKS